MRFMAGTVSESRMVENSSGRFFTLSAGFKEPVWTSFMLLG